MSDIPTHARAIPFDEAGMIATDVPCIKCGYNLRGLDEGRVCPECGTAVGRSLRGDFLKYCDPDWVGTVASGLNWIMLGVAIGVVGGAFVGALVGAKSAPPVAMELFILALSIIPLIGYWKLTVPDPSSDADTGFSPRRLVRITQVFGFCAQIPLRTGALGDYEMLETMLELVSSINMIVFVFAILIYLRRMALRIPNARLASSCRTIMWAWVIVLGIGLAGLIVAATATSTATSGSPPALGVGLICSASIAGTGMVILSLILALRLRRAFADEAKLARATWAAGVARPIAAI